MKSSSKSEKHGSKVLHRNAGADAGGTTQTHVPSPPPRIHTWNLEYISGLEPRQPSASIYNILYYIMVYLNGTQG